MPIVPDTKDWTWVLERRCPECGFESAAFERERVGDLIRKNAQDWQAFFEGVAERREMGLLAQRPSDDRWSTLEYACHVRDVFRLYDYRLGLMLTEDDPTFPNWDQDESAVTERYDEQDPTAVVEDLVAAGQALAKSFDAVEGAEWSCTGTRSDGAHFTVETFARYLVHDPIHHLHDIHQNHTRLTSS